ncbi:hypothetical protein G7085_02705 [Tessaracoccus sp. HDW20]|uniref:hypothetical protein n=1 Tax=Tessaracoccus coleopterorum TaxID=2714950 RepID=UPI0018D4634A|nr:hypothetical protein [Tessaracoccus coleopterorum]NHB83939.1 hypothetical protein [Tessaracoccus coleopterorum]
MTEALARRAAAFQHTGAEYHRLRPPYPDEVVDWALAPDARDVLDLGPAPAA